MDYDPITLAQKGLLIEEARTNILTKSNELTAWTKARSIVTVSTGFPIFANEVGFLLIGDGTSGGKGTSRFFTSLSTTWTMSVFLRRGTHNFAQILSGGGPDLTIFANYDILTGVVGSRGAGVISATMISWSDGWYCCTLTLSSSSVTSINVFLVSSATSVRGESNTLSTSIYVAGPQMEDGAFATSYIPTRASAVTRAGDFSSIDVNNIRNNPAEGTFGVELQTIFTTDSIPRYIITGDRNQLMYLASTTGTVASFDEQDPALTVSVSASGQLTKAYLRYSASGRSLSARGDDATSSSGAQNFSTMTTLRMGHLDTVPLCGWIRSLVYYPTRLSDAEIKTLNA
jgi:hypothetical protein